MFSRARWCFRQCAWPAKRRARKNHWRARENTARGSGGGAEGRISDFRFEMKLARSGGENFKFEI